MSLDSMHQVIDLLNQPDLLEQEREWAVFREGVDISIIYQEPNNGPSAAFLRYHPGAKVPPHQHVGYEHIFVLRGEQRDEKGQYCAGSLMIHGKDTGHQVYSETGCLVLAIWNRPVVFV